MKYGQILNTLFHVVACYLHCCIVDKYGKEADFVCWFLAVI